MNPNSSTAANAAGAGNLASGSPAVESRGQHPHPQADPSLNTSDLQHAEILTFADLPSDLGQLRSFDSAHHRVNNNNSDITSPPTSSNTLTPSNSGHLDRNASASPDARSARKPSPGLAARLKALGFGSSRDTSSPANLQLDRLGVGRLNEDQLRQLDHNHQAGSTRTVVERRGRPWKGAIARIPSIASLRGRSISAHTPPDDEESDALAVEGAAGATIVTSASDLLPEIQTTPPLEMDTNKYRLPDHTNGNGTKAQLETRQQHIERSSASLPGSPGLPPPPLPKDTPPLASQPAFSPTVEFDRNAASYFNPLGLQRPGSIYTLSRASFANQLAQLTSIQLPDAELLSNKVSAIPTAQAAARALIGAADQIRNWIAKASEVIGGLDSDDDVEWAAAGGREGYEEVENAITRFEELIHVYVGAIEQLQGRPDISNVSPEDLTQAVVQMEAIMEEWTRIRSTLQSVKGQVEIAMEWEELWNLVLGEIQNEMDELSRLVFEMEERRHRSIMAGVNGDGVDIGDLETIVEETPPHATRLKAAAASNRLSITGFPASPSSPVMPTVAQDDSSLLALFARMQPLRASLDFLPMRLSVFEARAQKSFPTACEELEMRREGLDGTYKKLEKDAESLRKELGEDRWVMVFRGAGRQAQKMYESVERSLVKLQEAVDAGMHLTNQPVMAKKIESYETKKTHYGPATERVLSIIDKGVKERLTVNGEILRLHTEMQRQWEELKERMQEMDLVIDELQSGNRGQQLRDSVSSLLSNDRSTIGSGNETPQSSPPSSVIMSGLGVDTVTPTNNRFINKRRTSSLSSHLPQPPARRSLSATGAGGTIPRKPVASRYSTLGPMTPSREGSVTPMGSRMPPRPASTLGNRPRWNGSTTGIDTGHNFKPLAVTQPSPFSKTPATRRMSSIPTPKLVTPESARTPLRSPLGRAGSASPMPDATPSKPPTSRLSFRDRISSPGPYAQQTLTKPRALSTQSSMSALGNRRASLQPPRANERPGVAARPASSLATTRRTSLLPASAKANAPGSASGRTTPQALAGARVAMRKNSEQKLPEKPRWR